MVVMFMMLLNFYQWLLIMKDMSAYYDSMTLIPQTAGLLVVRLTNPTLHCGLLAMVGSVGARAEGTNV